jgi:hypothetical protein
MKNSTDIHRESEIAPTRWPLVVAKKKKKPTNQNLTGQEDGCHHLTH